MKGIFEPLKALPFMEEALERLQEGGSILISGAGDSAQNHLAMGLSSFLCRPGVFILPNELKAREVYEELKFYDSEGTFFLPAKDPLFYLAQMKGLAAEGGRMKVLSALLSGDVRHLVISCEALFDGMMPKEEWAAFSLKAKIGEEIPLEELLSKLLSMGYERDEQVSAPGQFAVRGGIVDIYPFKAEAEVETAFRLEFWGDEIDSIRSIDPESQRSLEPLTEVKVLPVCEIMASPAQLEVGAKAIEKELQKQLKAFEKEENQEAIERLSSFAGRFLDHIKEGRARDLEAFLPYFVPEAVSVLSYMPADSILYLEEPARIMERLEQSAREFEESLKGRLLGGYMLPGQFALYPSLDKVLSFFQSYGKAQLCALPTTAQGGFSLDAYYTVNTKGASLTVTDERMLLEELSANNHAKYQSLVLSDSSFKQDQLLKLLLENHVDAYAYSDLSTPPSPGVVAVGRGNIARGFAYPDIHFAVYTLQSLSERSGKKTKRRHKRFSEGQALSSFSDLAIGDYVVHETFGVGLYQGIVQLKDEGTKKDYFKVVYKDGGILYVPITSLDMLQKYIAGENARPRLNNLAGQEWQRAKRKVREGVKELAENLTLLYAKRQERQGYAFGKDTVWQREFELSFPFEETEDQLRAIEETKKDMESHRIMDRLILGDVGYGKTEVAIRAAFKAVQEDKQVALLAPTTILAQQHFRTFLERMEGYPVRIGLLSRFRSKKEIAETLDGLKKGQVDIVIGTHRLLSKDVEFKDLGLLIVDEEQRFGVAHKERIKSLRENVDVMTLSATPIPRTLHMSLSGMRDMSLLEEAPMDRRPIQTYVMEDDEITIREAILRELSRKGQVFYLYNRVHFIEHEAARIAALVPNARVAFAHGQMDERHLEKVMLDFVEGEIDVLVCTTIVETGLDIPNANTLIVKDADRMGLSQMYQLRGRVGRSPRLAYAYFLYRKGKILSEDASSRLEAIGEFTDFGSGYKIALRDLQIRGAGNVLGPEQHGHMGAVGYDLYCKLLREAMKNAKEGEAEPVREAVDTLIKIKVDAFIPPEYIPNEGRKMEAYRRIATISCEEEYRDVLDELLDRYGDIPHQTQNLLKVALIKGLLQELRVEEAAYEGGLLHIRLGQDAPVDPQKLTVFMKELGPGAKLRPSGEKMEWLIPIEREGREEARLDRIVDMVKRLRSLKAEDANDTE